MGKYPFKEFAETGEFSRPFTFLDDEVYHAAAYALDRGKAVADPATARRKAVTAFVDVGRQDLQSHLAADTDVFRDLGGNVHHTCQERRHEFRRIV